MADPHTLLAPLIDPPLPPAPILRQAAEWDSLGPIVVLACLALLLVWVVRHWLRTAPQRALRRISRLQDPVLAAHALAALVRHHNKLPPANWQLELARLRFGPPSEDPAATITRLCLEARVLLKS